MKPLTSQLSPHITYIIEDEAFHDRFITQTESGVMMNNISGMLCYYLLLCHSHLKYATV